MKILLLTDLPPCDDYTAGLVLSAMARFVPKGALCCFAVVNPTIPVKISPEFSGVPVQFHMKPNENWTWVPRRRPVRLAANAFVNAGERLTHQLQVKPLVDKAVAFARAQGVDRVWAVLEGQTMIRMAVPVAEQLGVPLHTHVWDPFSWWAKANRLDPATTARVQAEFDRAISLSKGVATASQPMADIYRTRFGARAIPVIASHASSLARKPSPTIRPDGTVLIGMAGQFYSAGEWQNLVKAMKAANWRVAGRDVRIVVMGPQRPPDMDAGRISFLGWKTQPQAAEILSACDILYCPYPFDPAMKEVSELSFPSKLVLYLAAGRPIVFHGPDYSAPAAYVRRNGCGVVADKLFASAVYNAVETLVVTPDLYEAAATGAQRAFVQDFTLESMQRAFSDFLDLDAPAETPSLHDHGALPSSPSQPDRLPERTRAASPAVRALAVGRRVRDSGRAAKKRVLRSATNLALRLPRLRALKAEVHSLYAEVESLRTQLRETQARLAAQMTDEHRPVDPSDGKIAIGSAQELRQARAFYRGPRCLVVGTGGSVGHLPLFGPDGNSHADTAVGSPETFLVDLAEQTIQPLARTGDGEADFRSELLRLCLWHRPDELVVAVATSAASLVDAATSIAALLNIPLMIATPTGEAAGFENGSAADVLIRAWPVDAFPGGDDLQSAGPAQPRAAS